MDSSDTLKLQSLLEDNKENVEQTEKLETVDHSLAEVVAFSTKAMQFCSESKEGLLSSDRDGIKDRRIKIDYDSEKDDLLSFKSICQLKASLPNGKSAVGSCLRIGLLGKQYVLTCAHNLTSWSSFHNCFVDHSEGYAYCSRFGENKWQYLAELNMEHVKVHPNYDGNPACGFDIGVVPCKTIPHPNNRKVHASKVKDSLYRFVDPESIKVGMKIELCGYPGEKEGYPYYSQGVIKGIKKKKDVGVVLYYDTDSTPGMSGSEIMMVDKQWINDNINSERVKKVTIGVHTGHDHTVMLNYGTLLTPTLKDWMEGRDGAETKNGTTCCVS